MLLPQSSTPLQHIEGLSETQKSEQSPAAYRLTVEMTGETVTILLMSAKWLTDVPEICFGNIS